MTHDKTRVCIVTPIALSSNPRVVKEADALAANGFSVVVVYFEGPHAKWRDADRSLLADKRWEARAVRYDSEEGNRISKLLMEASHRAARMLPSAIWPLTKGAEYAESAIYRALTSVACRQSADLFIGHYPIGLAAASAAANDWGAALGYDAEDFHTGEEYSAAQTDRVRFLEQRYIPRCDYITAASDGIADALSAVYGIPRPTPVNNVFPLDERTGIDGLRQDRHSEELSLYWYSQTIGLDRGIQDAIIASGRLGGPVQIHLRGHCATDIRESLMRLAHQCGVATQVHLHEQVHPFELLSRAAEHDVGLALEQGTTLNRAICATNKMFFYMLAGLAIAATDVPGQRVVLSTLGEGAALYRPGNYEELSIILERWRTDPGLLTRAREASLDGARVHWNWERESARLVGVISEVIARRTVVRTAKNSGRPPSIAAAAVAPPQ